MHFKLSTKNIDHLALYKNLTEIAIHLIENGANVNATDNDGNTPLHLDNSSTFYFI